MSSSHQSMCPSAPWNSAGGKIFGVVGGEAKAPRVLFLKQLMTPSKELESRLGGVAPGEVFRVAAPCAASACSHHDKESKRCTLVERIVEKVEPAYADYTVCNIRAECVWWEQEGSKACVRCPQIATRNFYASKEVAQASAAPV